MSELDPQSGGAAGPVHTAKDRRYAGFERGALMQRIVMIVAICAAFAFVVTATMGLWRPSVYSLASAP